MKTWFLLAAISLGALISGCSTYGNEKVADENISSVSKKLIQGKTTRSEVKALYGEPTLVKNTSAGEEIWTYNHFRITPDPKSLIPVVNLFITPDDDYSSRTLDITFNKKGIVKSYEFSSSDSKKPQSKEK